MFHQLLIIVIFVTLAPGVIADQANAAPALKILTRDSSAIGGPALRYAKSFLQSTGAQLTVDQIPFEQLYDRIMLGFVTGKMDYDVLLIPSAWLADFAPYLTPLPDHLLDTVVVKDIHPAYRNDLMRWQGRWMALTVDGDLHMGVYRRDLFADARVRELFRQRYGRDLTPPRSWSEYSDIATFFKGRSDRNGRVLAGTLEAYSRGGQRLWYLFSHAAAYANHPDYPGGMFFDPVTMTPAITNPAWQRALSEYLQLIRSVPANAQALSSHEVRSRFSRGQAAMAIDWADIGVLASSRQDSAVSDDIGFFVLPGSRDVWNQGTQQWEQLSEVRNVPFLAFGGWIGAVTKSATDPANAWSYLAWYASPEHSMNDVLDGTSGINPYRVSHLDNAEAWRRLMGRSLADEYLAVLGQSLASPYATRDLRIPGYRAYMSALDEQLEQVLQNRISIGQALQLAAVQWEQITDRLGRDSQRRHYRAAMALPELTP